MLLPCDLFLEGKENFRPLCRGQDCIHERKHFKYLVETFLLILGHLLLCFDVLVLLSLDFLQAIDSE